MMLLAQTNKAGTADALLWIGLLILVVIVGSLVVVALRRKMLDNASADQETITMSDLRAMVEKGQLSQDEYDVMRAKMAKKASDAAMNDPKVQAQLSKLRAARKPKPGA